MITISAQQGSQEWLQHRAGCFNASDAPAMLGCSPYKTRSELLRELATGITPEVGATTQRLFDDGHAFEALARPLAEQIIGEELYPVTGTIDAGLSRPLGASFDGLTMAEDTAFEHKSMNDALRYAWDEGNGDHLPKHFRVQMEQQLLVSGAERDLFMATRWEGDECVEKRHCWYASDPALRAELLAGWKQFDDDLRTYQAEPATPEPPVGQSVTALPAVVVQVTGELSIRDNFRVFEVALRDFVETKLIREPQSDQDFADLDLQIKALKKAEEALDAAESAMLAQVSSVDTIKRAKDMLHKMARDNRLSAEKLLKNRKEEIKAQAIAEGTAKFKAHITALNARLGKPYMPAVPIDLAGAIRGLKTIDSLKNAIDTELARAKIAANEIADKIDANLKHLAAQDSDYLALFADAASIVQKDGDDFKTLVAHRISEHKAAEERRAEAYRQRIRQEEEHRAQQAAEAERERIRAEEERKVREAMAQEQAAVTAVQRAPQPLPAQPQRAVTAPPTNVSPMTPPSLKIGEINRRLGFTVTAEFLRTLHVNHATKQGASVLFHEHDWQTICAALVDHINNVSQEVAA